MIPQISLSPREYTLIGSTRSYYTASLVPKLLWRF